ncbi:hypothetical protein LshimejAT787_2000510 [Lyophyllum shimeji]|uniref:Uncharacterized protein n=1 Tax=Lyophyllum shimeji TaxID=47721 RepID=A0A9P3UWI8_LYOSH|nr:hypothetical protein LshimejAT787_2000510 [Lyophyllum shimeji]
MSISSQVRGMTARLRTSLYRNFSVTPVDSTAPAISLEGFDYRARHHALMHCRPLEARLLEVAASWVWGRKEGVAAVEKGDAGAEQTRARWALEWLFTPACPHLTGYSVSSTSSNSPLHHLHVLQQFVYAQAHLQQQQRQCSVPLGVSLAAGMSMDANVNVNVPVDVGITLQRQAPCASSLIWGSLYHL